MVELSLHQIEKKYGNHTVLSFENWTLNRGIYWLKGGNGVGKTTLFRIIAGQTPFNGTLKLNGKTIHEAPVAYRSMISYAAAEPQYPAFITGNDLLAYHLDVRKASRKTVEELVESFGMSGYMNQKIGSYSSGMLKKLSLICAFTGTVQLYILDEPLITIDHASTRLLYALIGRYAAEGSSFLLSSHQGLEQNVLDVSASFEIIGKQVRPC